MFLCLFTTACPKRVNGIIEKETLCMMCNQLRSANPSSSPFPSSQPAPSMNRPWPKTPAAGCSPNPLTSYTFVNDVRKTMTSSDRLLLRASPCMTAVRNDFGLKSPDNHSDLGSASAFVQVTSCWTRKIRSANHALRSLVERFDIEPFPDFSAK